ncbi:MAG: hypothetical protein AB1646_18250 [Thermodesulfobacteriota bacterium]
MKRFGLALAALGSFAASCFCVVVLLLSCAGHPPYTQLGIWVLPVSLVGAWLSLVIAKKCWKLRKEQEPLQ